MSKTNQILIVDDNPHMSSLLSDILDFFDYRAVGARDGEEALKTLTDKSFDMVITDLRMPGLDGPELDQRLLHQGEVLPTLHPSHCLEAAGEQGHVWLEAHLCRLLVERLEVEDLAGRGFSR